MDDIAARESIFERRVAHGYFVLSAAAGLFVDPAPGPVLANYGLESLRFTTPVYVGDTIQVKLTCKQKTAKEDREGQVPQGVVAWDVEVTQPERRALCDVHHPDPRAAAPGARGAARAGAGAGSRARQVGANCLKQASRFRRTFRRIVPLRDPQTHRGT